MPHYDSVIKNQAELQTVVFTANAWLSIFHAFAAFVMLDAFRQSLPHNLPVFLLLEKGTASSPHSHGFVARQNSRIR